MKKLLVLLYFLSTISLFAQQSQPIRVGIAGLTHGHVGTILRYTGDEIEIVGIAESNNELAKKLAERYQFSMDLVYPTLDEMIQATKPEAVAAFNSTFEHLAVVEACAPKGIHVMVEKPLAVNMDHASKMKVLVDEFQIHLITNYETTWYPTNHQAYQMVKGDQVGALRKVVIHDGHRGPMEIGVGQEFLEWLVDPKLNGGGAITDFGCYGANLITWLMEGEKPESVTAVTHTNKPDIYKQVDDEATIILQYPKTQVIIQASWNWPFSRKDMEIYGQSGSIFSQDKAVLRYQLRSDVPEQKDILPPRKAPFGNPFSFFSGVVSGNIIVSPTDLSSLENNLIVVEILDAARKSAAKGELVKIN